MGTWVGWEGDVLAKLGAPNNVATAKFLSDWHGYEQSACANNPLNTTLVRSGSTACNMAGVQSYPTPTEGAAATAATLENGYYPAIVAALRSGDPYTYGDPSAVAAQITKWGTPNYAAAYSVTAGAPAGAPGAASGGTPTQPPGPTLQTAWGQLMRTIARAAPAKLSAGRHAIVVLHRLQRRV